MRADVHQVLAYAATVGQARRVVATLMYPLASDLFEELEACHRTEAKVEIPVGSISVTLRLIAKPFR